MSTDLPNPDEITQTRREAIADTIHPISAEQMRELGNALFPTLDNPWREKFFALLDENPGATFHHATTDDPIHILYCDAQNRGMWFTPGSGMGPLQPKGLAILKELVGKKS